jgi:hypothetical protein
MASEKALTRIAIAIEAWIEAMADAGVDVSTLSAVDIITTVLTATTGQHLTIQAVTGKDVKFALTDNAGVRKVYVLDSDAATVFSIDSNGAVTGSSFVGPLTGAVNGNVTGNLTGDSAGTHTGAVTGDVAGNLTGSVIAGADVAVDFAAGHADHTLTATEKKASLIVASNADAGANIIGPAENRQYVIRNASGQAVTIKKAGGTGFAIANSKTAVARYSSSVADYVRVTADATH